MRGLKERLTRLEQHFAERPTDQCDICREWPFVRVRRIDVDGTETWETEEPRECPKCGWCAHLVTFEIIKDWTSVSVPSRGR